MTTVLLAARLLLTGVLVTAGLAKLADLAGSRRALTDFGVPARAVSPSAVALPIAELASAGALLPSQSARYGAAAAALLLGLFTAAITVMLSQGRAPDCHCFGQLHSAPVSGRTLARNSILFAVAILVMSAGWHDPGPGFGAWLGGFSSTEWLSVAIAGTGAVAIIEGWILLHVLQQQGRILLRLESVEVSGGAGGHTAAGLPLGAPAPDFKLPSLSGETVSLSSVLESGRRTMFLFTDPDCGPCRSLMPEVARWQRDHARTLNVIVVSRGDPRTNRTKVAASGVQQVLLQKDQELALAYQYAGTPSAVLVSADGRIASSVVPGERAIRALVQEVVRGQLSVIPVPLAMGNGGTHAHGHIAPPSIGSPAPRLILPDLDGNPVDLEQYRGTPILVLSWSPDCGFCQAMLDELKAWEQSAPQGGPKMVVVSTGSVEANRAMGLRSLILLDEDSQAMARLGASGTPMAVLVDAEGKIASSLAAGADAVLALAGARREVGPRRPH